MSAARRASSRDPERDEAHSVAAFLAHWDRAREEGRITAREANAVLSACRAVLGTADASLEHTPIGELDVDALCEHFEREKEGGTYKLNTMLTYVGRFRGALESYRHFLAAPEAWTHGGRRRPGPEFVQSEEPALQDYLYPIRDGVLARLSIPRDTTAHEMARFAEFARTLAADFDPTPDRR